MDELRIWSVDKSSDIATKSYRCSPLSAAPTRLVRYYKFDETTGTTASDSSGNAKNGTLQNGNNPLRLMAQLTVSFGLPPPLILT